MHATDAQISQMLALAAKASPHEACGLLLDDGRVYPCANVAGNPACHFEIDPLDQAAAEQLGQVVGVWHSHPDGTAEPSLIDRAMCERTALPWHIVSPALGDYRYLAPCGWQAPYVGRPYCYGVFDCWELIRDWMRRERGVLLSRPLETEGWWEQGQPLFAQHAAANGFEPLDDPLEPGDVLMLQIGASVANHLALWLGDGLILHHLKDRASEIHLYGSYWQRCTVSHWRHQT